MQIRTPRSLERRSPMGVGRFLSTLAFVLLAATLLPLFAAETASAQGAQDTSSSTSWSSSEETSSLLDVNGRTDLAPVVSAKTTVEVVQPNEELLPVSLISSSRVEESTVALGSLGVSPVALGDLGEFCRTVIDPWGLNGLCSKKTIVEDLKLASCGGVVTWFVTDYCPSTVKSVLWRVGEKLLPSVKALMAQILKPVKELAKQITNWVLNTELGGNNAAQTPVVDCKTATGEGAQKKCAGGGGAWLTGQYALMIQIGLFVLVPLLMLAVIQAIIRGSLFFLMRAALIMLPVAIIGTVVALTMTQLLLNINDDFARALASYTTSTSCAAENGGTTSSCYGTLINQKIDSLHDESGGLFAVGWLLLFSIAGIVMMIEMLLREASIYLAVFFLPLGFAALVWPATARYGKHLVKLIIGLAFMPVFMVAALALGISGVVSSGETNGDLQPVAASSTADAEAQGISPEQNENDQAIASIAGGAAVLIMAATSGFIAGSGKIIALTPIAGAVDSKLAEPGSFWSKGQITTRALGKLQTRRNNKFARM